MAITDPNTVLILGAGVSVPFGLPTGAQLIDDISKSLEHQIDEYLNNIELSNPETKLHPTNRIEPFIKFPFLQPLIWKNGYLNENLQESIKIKTFRESINKDIETMKDLKGLLKNQTSDSIDDFIILNPNYSEYVKICIAAQFINSLYRLPHQHERGLQLKNIEQRYLEIGATTKSQLERNWIHRLINLIRLGVSEGKVTKENKVQIITFNYDTILEHVLSQQFSNVQNGKEKFSDYHDFIEIIHVHGRCENLTESILTPGKTCWAWATGIKVIREGTEHISNEVSKAREYARSIIKEAKEIYCCGFAFAKANTDLIGLSKTVHSKREIFYSNYSSDIGLKKAAEKFYKKSKSKRVVYSDVHEENNIGVADWIGIGTIGELP